MKKNFLNSLKVFVAAMLITFMALTSCNKKLEQPQPIINAQDTATVTIGDYLTSDANYSLYKLMLVKVGVYANLTNNHQVNTVFAPNNNAIKQLISFVSQGAIPLSAPDQVFQGFITGASAQTVAALFGPIAQYSIVPGISLSTLPETFPNVQLPTTLSPSSIPGTLLPFALTAFPSQRGPFGFYNNVPSVGKLASFTNGAVYGLAAVAVPPSKVVAQILGDPQFSLYSAVVNRGDSGQPAATRISAAFANPGANLTVFAPTNDAIKKLIVYLSQGQIPFGAPEAYFTNFINTYVPVQTARGLAVYHILGTRAFSVNFPPTATFFPTLLNLAIPNHPGVKVQSFFTGPVVDSIKVYGVGNGGAAATSKPRGNFDVNAVNGVVHIIDMVLLPQ